MLCSSIGERSTSRQSPRRLWNKSVVCRVNVRHEALTNTLSRTVLQTPSSDHKGGKRIKQVQRRHIAYAYYLAKLGSEYTLQSAVFTYVLAPML